MSLISKIISAPSHLINSVSSAIGGLGEKVIKDVPGLSSLGHAISNAIPGGWDRIRNLGETAGTLALNYKFPGSSLLTTPLESKGSQAQLNSPLGELAQIGTGLAGAGVGSATTGIPAGVGWTAGLNNVGGLVGDATLGTDVVGGLTNAISPITNAFNSAETGVGNFLSNAGTGVSNFLSSVNPFSSTGSVAATATDPLASSTLPWSDTYTGGGGTSALLSGEPAGTSISPTLAAADQAATTAAGGTGGTAGTAATAGKTGGIWDAIKGNKGLLIPGAELLYGAIKGNQAYPGEKQISAQADQLGAQGKLLSSYLASGQLPPGVQASLNQMAEAEKASIRSQHAAQGTSGSSAEAQELSAVDGRIQAAGVNYATNLLKTGIDETGISAGLYQGIMNSAMAEDQQMANAFKDFGIAALGGNTGGRGGANSYAGGTSVPVATGL